MADLIDRRVAIDALREYIVDNDMYDMDENVQGFNDGIDLAISELSIIPSAQPTVEERKKGKWIKQPYMNDTVWIIRCSNCMKVGNVGSGIGFKYCPHCGADMRGD